MNKWALFIISIGFLILASSPMFTNQIVSILMGGVVISLGIYVYMKKGKDE
ncbi:MAG: hypothetical protein ACTH1V_07110 [Alkalibacterium gilvum]|uniref:Uncharacterized protein n=1 Tax=Alkalibacterium gilvum TaxID=1130080 RepID=A0A1H6RUM8_9LACT|nr:hypothetical protein [Alkalibacterium gilvum]SEI56247.1 Protein of unknown function [Alkalibacterium gilvum]